MKKSMKIIIGFMKKEFAQALRDPVMRVFIFIAPIIQLTLFGYAINTEFSNIKLAVFSTPPDTMARQLAESFYSTGYFLRVTAEGLPEDLLQAGKADAVLVMPAGGLTKAFGRQDAVMQLLIDASNATKARAVERYAKAVLQRFIAAKSGANAAAAAPVTFDIRVLFNPTMETSIFMVPGIMTLIMSLITIILTSMSIAREKELGTFETIIAAPIRKRDIIAGKAVPFMIIGFIDAIIVLTAGIVFFNVPVRGSAVYLIAATVVYVITTVSIGLLISTIAQTQQQAMMGTFMFEFPAILLSGVIFPIENMPGALRVFAYVNPLMYYVKVIRNVMLKGANPDIVFSCIFMLVVLGSVIITATIARFRQKLN